MMPQSEKSSMHITLRKATTRDAGLVAELNMIVHQPHVEANPERYKPLSPDDPDLIDEMRYRLTMTENHTFIADDQGEAVGYVMCFLREQPGNIFVHSVTDFHIDQLAVRESHRRRGIARQLMERAMQTAREHQVDIVTLGVAAFNDGAIRFYQQLGFTFRHHSMVLRQDR